MRALAMGTERWVHGHHHRKTKHIAIAHIVVSNRAANKSFMAQSFANFQE
jgi:hypothetical protein